MNDKHSRHDAPKKAIDGLLIVHDGLRQRLLEENDAVTEWQKKLAIVKTLYREKADERKRRMQEAEADYHQSMIADD